MFCEKCGNKIKDGAKFCGKCGTKVEINTLTDIEKKDENKVYNGPQNNDHERLIYISNLVDVLKEVLNKKKSAVSCLEEFGRYLESEQTIPQPLPDEPEHLFEIKDIWNVFIKGIITAIVLTLIATYGEEKFAFRDFLGCSIFCWFVIGGFVYFKKSREYEKLKEASIKQKEEMLRNVDGRKYDSEDLIFGLINKNYNQYIGDGAFDSTSIRDHSKDAFQAELAEIIKFAEDNKMYALTLSEIIEKFYQNKHHSKVAELWEYMGESKEKVLELKSKFEVMEIQSDIDYALERLGAFLEITPENVSLSVDRYRIALRDISTDVEQIEQALEAEIDIRERAADALMSYVPEYKKTLKKISLKRVKYPDEQLSSSFIKSFDSKVNELTNALPTSYEAVKNRAAEIDSEIKSGIACLTDMLEAELQSRYKRVYGRPENKLALKFKSTYK